MAGVNKCIILGRLVRDPETRNFPAGGQVVSLRVATSETWRDKQSGEKKERSEFHSVSIFNEALGKIAEQYLRKGSEVYLEGQLETRKWQDQSGADRYTTEVVLRPFNGTLTLIGGKRDDQGQQDRQDDSGQIGGSGYGSGGGPNSGGRSDMDSEIPFNMEWR